MRLNFIFVMILSGLHHGDSYVIVNSMSWAVTAEVEELDPSSNEETIPALLEDTGSFWKQSYPGSVINNDVERRAAPNTVDAKQISTPSRMFSYKREAVSSVDSPPPHPHDEIAKTARYLAHYSSRGFLATISTHEKIKGVPFGNIFSISDGLPDNSTGIPLFYVTPMDSSVADLMNSSLASLTFSEAEGDYCSENMVDPEDPRCARLTLTGQMVAVELGELEFAKEAMFSRHPVMRKWPITHNWFFMKLNIKQVWLQNWFGGVYMIPLEDYFKASPTKS
ncbi:Protein CREG2 [Acipenser ruthenus]|uniref:Protein CREG2 n=1 Tax=Acipenser ruthenus TaxID=7906 RepID=A0A662YY49_ACIRT|nr:protein CREG2-like [Acipenser ruthenus]RXN01473.1 Protein CREG2 [Acipenser ruthenus]